MSLMIGSITFGADGSMAIDYMDSARDRKASGTQTQHTLVIAVDDVPASLAELEIAAQRALAELLVQLEELAPAELDEDDDEPAYDNPNERERVRE